MVEVLIGIISGTISGTGMGGGTILIFLLTVLCRLEQHIAQATNLIFFIYLAGLAEDFLYFLSLLYLIIRLAYFTVLTLYVQ